MAAIRRQRTLYKVKREGKKSKQQRRFGNLVGDPRRPHRIVGNRTRSTSSSFRIDEARGYQPDGQRGGGRGNTKGLARRRDVSEKKAIEGRADRTKKSK